MSKQNFNMKLETNYNFNKNKDNNILTKNINIDPIKQKKSFSASKIKINFKNIKSRFLVDYDMNNLNFTMISDCNLNVDQIKELIYLPKKIIPISHSLSMSQNKVNFKIPKLKFHSVIKLIFFIKYDFIKQS